MTLPEQIVAVVVATGCSRVVAEFLLRSGSKETTDPAAQVSEAICDAVEWNRSSCPRASDPIS